MSKDEEAGARGTGPPGTARRNASSTASFSEEQATTGSVAESASAMRSRDSPMASTALPRRARAGAGGGEGAALGAPGAGAAGERPALVAAAEDREHRGRERLDALEGGVHVGGLGVLVEGDALHHGDL